MKLRARYWQKLLMTFDNEHGAKLSHGACRMCPKRGSQYTTTHGRTHARMRKYKIPGVRKTRSIQEVDYRQDMNNEPGRKLEGTTIQSSHLLSPQCCIDNRVPNH